MLEWIAKTGLLFSQPETYAFIIIIGFLFSREKIFGQALFLLTFTMIYNVYLKSIWQIPLPPPLEGWGFPSGHMHSSVVFWGYLALSYRKLGFSAIVLFILCLIGYGLIYQGYHYPVDILGAWLFGGLSLLIYTVLLKLSFFKAQPYRIGFLLSLIASIIIGLLGLKATKPHLWQAFGLLNGFLLGWIILEHNVVPPFNYRQNAITLVVAVLGALCYFLLIKQLPLSAHTMIFVEFFAVALWISASKVVVNKMLLSKQNT